MSENPFGGFDLNALMAQAQEMQAQLAAAQDRLAETTVDGSALGGAVSVTVSGIGELTGVTIKPGTVSSDEDLDDLGAAIVAAYRDARAKADELATQAMGPLAGGFDQPGSPFQLGL